MPTYEYKCKECDNIQERIHGMKENPVIKCSSCGSKNTRKVIQATSFSVKHTIAKRKFKDNAKKHDYMKTDLKENYNVHEVKPLKAGERHEDIYNYCTKNKSFVKEKMSAEIETSHARKEKRQKEWHKKAQARFKRDEAKIRKKFLEGAAKKKQQGEQ